MKQIDISIASELSSNLISFPEYRVVSLNILLLECHNLYPISWFKRPVNANYSGETCGESWMVKGPATLKTLQVTKIEKGSRFVNHLAQKQTSHVEVLLAKCVMKMAGNWLGFLLGLHEPSLSRLRYRKTQMTCTDIF